MQVGRETQRERESLFPWGYISLSLGGTRCLFKMTNELPRLLWALDVFTLVVRLIGLYSPHLLLCLQQSCTGEGGEECQTPCWNTCCDPLGCEKLQLPDAATGSCSAFYSAPMCSSLCSPFLANCQRCPTPRPFQTTPSPFLHTRSGSPLTPASSQADIRPLQGQVSHIL